MRRLAERLASALKEPFFIHGTEVQVTASIGLASYPEHGLRGEDLLEAADAAMYGVKSSGKDGILRAPSKTRVASAAAA
jgi:diguanylate cyclase (GGDEF)-like protein